MDNLKDKFDQFGKDPSPAVWDKIDSALNQEDSKIIGWWFYAAAGAALILGLGYYGFQNSIDQNSNNVVEKVIPTLYENSSQESPDTIIGFDEKETNSPDKTHENIFELESFTQINDDPLTERNDVENVKETDQRANRQTDANVVTNDSDNRNNESVTVNAKLIDKVGSEISIDDEITATAETEVGTALLQNDNGNEGFAIKSNNPSLSSSVNDKNDPEKLDDISFIDNLLTQPIVNQRIASPINRDLILPDINSDSWAFSANFKQGFIDNKTVGVSRIASVNESFTLTNLDYKVESNYINDKPLWIDLHAQKKISDNYDLILSVEYGQQKSSITVDDKTIFSNDNKNISAGLGIGHELMEINRISVGLNGILRAGNEINEWKKIDITDNPEPTTSNFDSPSADIIDQAVINKPVSKSNLMTNGEVSLPIKYQLTKNIAVQLTPFIRQYLSQKYPGSDNFGESFQWGLAGGITF